jgi:hypothetical protein
MIAPPASTIRQLAETGWQDSNNSELSYGSEIPKSLGPLPCENKPGGGKFRCMRENPVVSGATHVRILYGIMNT